MDLQELRKHQEELYIKIADAKGDELENLLDEVWKIEDQIDDIENPPTIPMTIGEYEDQYGIQTKYENFHDEYGDAAALYSDYLQVAGTVDCIAEFDGRLSVIDFKTSKRIKTREDIHGYFMQTAAYAVMFEERTKIPVDRLVVLMSVDDNPALMFVEKRDDWISSFIELREDYAKLKGH
jgi:genome maintenance exonuclease 1